MKKPVILCIDDENIVLNSLKEQLKKAINGCDIEIAESGAEALEFIDELLEDNGELSIVISDYIMPGMKGDEVLSQIHKNIPKAIKILLTGQATTDGITNSVNNANLYRYIAKPWEESDLFLTINEALKSYNMEMKLEEQNISLELYNKELISFTDAIVETMVAAIDTRDTTTAGHSKRLAQYAVKLAESINKVNYGKYKDFKFTKIQINELRYAALLHDVGKIGVKESILQKEFRLSVENQNEIKIRFAYLKKCLELKKVKEEISDEEINILYNLDENLKFVIEISRRGYVVKEEIDKIQHIAEIQYLDEENTKCNLLSNLEVENLIIQRGNLTNSEREIINSHVVHTYNILNKILWTKELEKVPYIAASHHERLDGTGYSNGIKEEQLTVQTRILNILDVFEALTALDRSYKPPMSIEKALEIIEDDVFAGKFDKDLYEIFINEKVYNLHSDILN
jgi:response regulator RpfG family c-di-GMP phosphodiesterase